MYEYDNDKVVQTSEMNLKNYEISAVCGLANESTVPSVVDCFSFGKESIYIGIERAGSYNLLADGVELDFLVIQYANDSFKEVSSSSVSGSGLQYQEFRSYMFELQCLGAYANWNELYTQNRHVKDYLPNVSEIAMSTSHFLCDYDDYWEWHDQSSGEDLKCTEIMFKSEDELYKGNGEFYSETNHLNEYNPYENIYFYYEDFENGDSYLNDNLSLKSNLAKTYDYYLTKLVEDQIPEPGVSYTVIDYSLVDIEQDGIPEMIVKYGGVNIPTGLGLQEFQLIGYSKAKKQVVNLDGLGLLVRDVYYCKNEKALVAELSFGNESTYGYYRLKDDHLELIGYTMNLDWNSVDYCDFINIYSQ